MTDLLTLLEKSLAYEAELKRLRIENANLRAWLDLANARLANHQRGMEWSLQQ